MYIENCFCWFLFGVEDNTTVEDSKEVLKETANDVKEENQVVPAAENKDFHEKANGLASGDEQTPSEGGFFFFIRFYKFPLNYGSCLGLQSEL